jgi:2-phospho-L-lactate guanylyltransferase
VGSVTHPAVDLVVPVKPLSAAKSRLRGAADGGVGETRAHTRLALALAHDTIAAVLATPAVRRLLVVSSDPAVAAELAALGIDVVPDGPSGGLNRAYAGGAALLRARDRGCAVGALQADLPALRPAELGAAVEAALGLGGRSFSADADGTGTTFLLAAPGHDLDPRFGPGSARRHAESGAHPLAGRWPGLRRDVDTPADLDVAAALGLGSHTRAVLAPCPGF